MTDLNRKGFSTLWHARALRVVQMVWRLAVIVGWLEFGQPQYLKLRTKKGREMKKSISLVAAVAVLLVTVGSLSAVSPKPAPQITGGYSDVEVTNEDARANAEWAVREQMQKSGGSIELLTLRKAELQVVAGLNYRFCMQVTVEGKNGADAETYFVTAVVYVDLKQKKQLTTWGKSECEAASEPKGTCG